jgi:WhiB family redox-sensing transcriptional regulator
MADIRRLPAPLAEFWDWQLHAACRTADPSVFFHPENERGPARSARERAAKSICSTCPVITECREFALRTRETYGVWGGLSESDREAIYARARGDREALAS